MVDYDTFTTLVLSMLSALGVLQVMKNFLLFIFSIAGFFALVRALSGGSR
ncbi:MAG TPA: hypothetical protein VLL52_22525 [Anaerolineae bacterium]|nr:hypothetical protein [Anaerolineae bacterium]